MQRRHFVTASVAALAYGGLLLSGCSTTTGSGESAATDMAKRQSIDASVDGALAKLYTSVQGSRELVGKAQGILVFPSVLQVGFVVGGQYGEGALRVGGSTAGYYSTISGSFGLTAGEVRIVQRRFGAGALELRLLGFGRRFEFVVEAFFLESAHAIRTCRPSKGEEAEPTLAPPIFKPELACNSS